MLCCIKQWTILFLKKMGDNMNNISVIGIGKLGLCFALSLEGSGYNVVGVDISKSYVDSINNRTFFSFEEQVNERLQKANNFLATTDLDLALLHSDVVFAAVATPSLPNGRYNHTQVESLVDVLISKGVQPKTKNLVINCTTMPQYSESVYKRLKDYNWNVAYNPEFIAQGTIIRNQENPDMVLIGESNKEIGDILQVIYNRMTKNEPKIHRMSLTEAEICKISLNCFLTTKIAYTNMIGDIAISSGCDPQVILDAIGQDTRVGTKLTRYGYGFGGPCFPRDNRAISIFADDNGIDAKISKATDSMNKLHLHYQVQQYLQSGKKEFVTNSVTYKPESTMIEESQQLAFAVELANNGIKVTIVETPVVIEQVTNVYGNLFTYLEK